MCHTVTVDNKAQIVLLQDQWIGDADNSKAPGNFGIWHFCTGRYVFVAICMIDFSCIVSINLSLLCPSSQDGREVCCGRLDDFGTILSPAFLAATVFTGLAVIISILGIIAFVLFFMCRYSALQVYQQQLSHQERLANHLIDFNRQRQNRE